MSTQKELYESRINEKCSKISGRGEIVEWEHTGKKGKIFVSFRVEARNKMHVNRLTYR